MAPPVSAPASAAAKDAGDPAQLRLVLALVLPAEDSAGGATRSSPGRLPVAVPDPLAGKDAAVAGARAAAGVAPQTLRVRWPGEWVFLDFPAEDQQAVQAYADAAFAHRGWPLIQSFQTDFQVSLAGARAAERQGHGEPARRFAQAINRLEQAMDTLRPRVAASLDRLETAAVAVLRGRLDLAVQQARDQALQLLVLPTFGGKPLSADTFLSSVSSRGGPLAMRRGPAPLAAHETGRRFRALVDRLRPQAQAFEKADQSRGIQSAFDAIRTAVKVAAVVTAGTPPSFVDGSLDAQARWIEAAQAAGALPDAIDEAIRSHRDGLRQWADLQQGFIAARRAAAAEFPVLHRFGFKDVIDAQQQDAQALGARIVRKLAGIYGGAFSVRASHVAGVPGSKVQPVRPAQALRQAMRRADPPRDPVAFVIEQSEGSVWRHPALIQAATQALAEDPALGGPMSLLDSFDAAVSAQALAEFSRSQQRAMVGGVVEAIGVTAGMIALHAIAPPLAFAADAALAAGDLSGGLSEFGGQSALSRCSFDPLTALGEEPSLAWFLATQAFNVLTVG